MKVDPKIALSDKRSIGPPVFQGERLPFTPLPQKPVNLKELFLSQGIPQEFIGRAKILGFQGNSISSKILSPRSGELERIERLGIGIRFVTSQDLTPKIRIPQNLPSDLQKEVEKTLASRPDLRKIEQEVPRDKGRGYVINDVWVEIEPGFPSEKTFLGLTLHFKGTGRGGNIERTFEEVMQAKDPFTYFGNRLDASKTMGAFADWQIVLDLCGEIIARDANLPVPRTIVLTELEEYFTDKGELVNPSTSADLLNARLFVTAKAWTDGNRVWALTSNPQRTGRYIGQSIFDFPLPLELFYSLRYGNLIKQFANNAVNQYLNRCGIIREIFGEKFKLGVGSSMEFEQLKSTPARLDSYLESMQGQIYNLLLGVIKKRIHLDPFTIHLANISFSGQFSGFDRYKGDEEQDMNIVRSGIASAILETYVALNILRAVLVGSTLSFSDFFRDFQERLQASGEINHQLKSAFSAASFTEFLNKGTVKSNEDLIELGEGYPFSFRYKKDADKIITALETFNTLLAEVYRGNFKSPEELKNAIKSFKIDPNLLYKEPVFQLYGGIFHDPSIRPSLRMFIEKEVQERKGLTERLIKLMFEGNPQN